MGNIELRGQEKEYMTELEAIGWIEELRKLKNDTVKILDARSRLYRRH